MICDQTASGARRPTTGHRREDGSPQGQAAQTCGLVHDSRPRMRHARQLAVELAEALYQRGGCNRLPGIED
jgi:hypothetical protein